MSGPEDGAAGGDAPGDDGLWHRAYDVLRRLAALSMRGERKDHTLDPTALVNEAFVRLSSIRNRMPSDEPAFLALASHKMRQVLVDHARRDKTKKRGESWARITLHEGVLITPRRHLDIIALDEAMESLAAHHPRTAQVVELRFFMGMTEIEVASVLEVSRQTVERQWAFGKAWLARELKRG